jgi:hypothetical protein
MQTCEGNRYSGAPKNSPVLYYPIPFLVHPQPKNDEKEEEESEFALLSGRDAVMDDLIGVLGEGWWTTVTNHSKKYTAKSQTERKSP